MTNEVLQTAFESLAVDDRISRSRIKKCLLDAVVIGEDKEITKFDVDIVVTENSNDKENNDFAKLRECDKTLTKEKKAEPKELKEMLVRAELEECDKTLTVEKEAKPKELKETLVKADLKEFDRTLAEEKEAKPEEFIEKHVRAELKECDKTLAKEQQAEPKEITEALVRAEKKSFRQIKNGLQEFFKIFCSEYKVKGNSNTPRTVSHTNEIKLVHK